MSERLNIPFEGIVEQSLAGMYVIQDEIFVYVNATFAGMLGYSVAEMTGMDLRKAVVPEIYQETLANFHRRISGEVPSIRYTTVGQHKHGYPVILEVHGSRLDYCGRPAVVGVGINITEQVAQQEALQASRERLRELAEYINVAREEQRSRIARELHDVVGGMLTSIKLDVARIARRADTDELRGIVADLRQLTQECIDTVRSMSEDLRPSVLDHCGLTAALDAALRQFSERTDISSQLIADDYQASLSQQQETAIFRICQEALTNVTRHAEASAVVVRLHSDATHVVMSIEDNGRGLPVPTPTGKRIGLLGMAERARELGGEFGVASLPDGGTGLRLCIPIGERDD